MKSAFFLAGLAALGLSAALAAPARADCDDGYGYRRYGGYRDRDRVSVDFRINVDSGRRYRRDGYRDGYYDRDRCYDRDRYYSRDRCYDRGYYRRDCDYDRDRCYRR